MNASTLITRLLPALHASSEANLVGTSRADLLERIDESIKRMARLALFFIVRDTSISSANGTATYTLAANHLATLHVSLGGVPLISSSRHEIESLDEDYKATTGNTEHWYGDGEGLNKIGVYPVPTASKTFAIIEQEIPAEISDPSALTVTMPSVFDDYIDIRLLREVYTSESDICMQEVAAPLDKLLTVYETAMIQLYGKGQ